MTSARAPRCTAFEGDRCIASGTLPEVARAAKEVLDANEHAPVLVFDDTTSRPIEFDLRGTVDEVVSRVAAAGEAQDADAPPAAAPSRGRGRPRLGVVSREVTLLPRHWSWLAAQRGGASGALRKLVDKARRDDAGGERTRQAQDAAYRFSSAMAGNQPGFEESMRALFAGDADRFQADTQEWPEDVRTHARGLALAAFQGASVKTRDGEGR